MRNFLFKKDFIIPLVLFLINFGLQIFNLGQKVVYYTDEGVYLYSSKLILQGYIPYRDFFLAHPPFLIYSNVLPLLLANFNLNVYHIFIVAWVLSTIFPLYWIVNHLTKDNFSSICALVLFITYSELQVTDIYSFALRQASLPFFAWALYFFLIKNREFLASFLLGIFSICLVSNLALSILFLAIFIGQKYVKSQKTFISVLHRYKLVIAVFLGISYLGYLSVFLIPHGIDNVFNYQFSRSTLSFTDRLIILVKAIMNDFAIFSFGILGSIFLYTKSKLLTLYNILGLILISFLATSFAEHYLVVLAVSFSVVSGLLISQIASSYTKKIITVAFLLSIISLTSGPKIIHFLLFYKTPEVLHVVELLKNEPNPLFTFQPIVALLGKKDIVFHYHVADTRYFTITGVHSNLEAKYSTELLKKSSTVFLDDYAIFTFSPEAFEYIKHNFRILYKSPIGYIYTRKQ